MKKKTIEVKQELFVEKTTGGIVVREILEKLVTPEDQAVAAQSIWDNFLKGLGVNKTDGDSTKKVN